MLMGIHTYQGNQTYAHLRSHTCIFMPTCIRHVHIHINGRVTLPGNLIAITTRLAQYIIKYIATITIYIIYIVISYSCIYESENNNNNNNNSIFI